MGFPGGNSLVLKNPLSNTGVRHRRGQLDLWVSEDPLEEEMATHFIAWTEGPGGLQSMGPQSVKHDWAHTHLH